MLEEEGEIRGLDVKPESQMIYFAHPDNLKAQDANSTPSADLDCTAAEVIGCEWAPKTDKDGHPVIWRLEAVKLESFQLSQKTKCT